MNGAEHYAEAERLLDGPINVQPEEFEELRRDNLAAAQVHATLTLVAATVNAAGVDVMHYTDRDGLAHESRDVPGEWDGVLR